MILPTTHVLLVRHILVAACTIREGWVARVGDSKVTRMGHVAGSTQRRCSVLAGESSIESGD